jgi:hypothetical protein
MLMKHVFLYLVVLSIFLSLTIDIPNEKKKNTPFDLVMLLRVSFEEKKKKRKLHDFVSRVKNTS